MESRDTSRAQRRWRFGRRRRRGERDEEPVDPELEFRLSKIAWVGTLLISVLWATMFLVWDRNRAVLETMERIRADIRDGVYSTDPRAVTGPVAPNPTEDARDPPPP